MEISTRVRSCQMDEMPGSSTTNLSSTGLQDLTLGSFSLGTSSLTARPWLMKSPTPPQPSDRVGGYASLDFVESRVVAVLGFSDPTTEPIVRGYAVSTPTASVQHTRLLDGPEVPDPRPACCVEACIGA